MSVEQDSSAQDSDRAQARITEVVENYIDFLTNGTAEQIADLYAPDATVEDPIGADVRSTREQLVEFYSIITNMDERTATLKWKKIAGDTAVFEFTLVTGTSGMRFEITPVDIMVFDADGKIASMRAVWQPSDLVQL
ncbi:nuclear transport factor 2 family protein [Gordonia polyisoprenivorans]|uniref:nuclear transport factor 2 family protein n=1 Tax=Gordonia polyisoprenivorans TaxID=84595 RepID=UPI002234B053|nr:nuclear transport factor 2 family protein [Gordonia polyisoprenivorans]